ncbi:hypothetical protein AMC99_00275 [Altererythrobacter epoxidivorans]|uniref:Uncharacterized protein n=1 Tax=Altererythrobacter epoxidivorans TaxID=361183 RepID=A0A0M4LSN7_9SPHN|nr:hypothetical protein [Altererythrobacter epoxidivorans]ALE15591.1 hypothetical protein AMC99_00275 [Altererythrobacter epoxidivorans]
MNSSKQGVSRPTATVRVCVMAASLAVAACFSAAAALADEPAADNPVIAAELSR